MLIDRPSSFIGEILIFKPQGSNIAMVVVCERAGRESGTHGYVLMVIVAT